MSAKTRSVLPDALRGIGIFWMVIGHYLHFSFLKAWIYSFHMPLFFVLSGVFLNASLSLGPIEFLKKRAKSLLFPYLCCGGILCLLTLPSSAQDALSMARSLLWFNTDSAALDAGTLWFLTALFLSEVFFYILFNRLKKQDGLLGVVCFVLALIGTQLRRVVLLPFAADAALVALFFLWVGHRFRHRFLQETPWRFGFFASVGLFCAHVAFAWLPGLYFGAERTFSAGMTAARVGMRTATYPFPLLFFFTALLGTFVNALFVGVLLRSRGRAAKLGVRSLCFLGQNSLVFLLFSSFIGNRLGALKNALISQKLRFPLSYVWIFTQISLIFALTALLAVLFLKTPLRRLLGKSPANKRRHDA